MNDSLEFEIRILNISFKPISIVTRYSSLIWNDVYCGIGDFELVVPTTDFDPSIYALNNYVSVSTSKCTMIIESIKDDTSNGTTTISGRSLTSLLERRVIAYKAHYEENLNVEGSAFENTYRNDARTDGQFIAAIRDMYKACFTKSSIIDTAVSDYTANPICRRYTDSYRDMSEMSSYVGILRDPNRHIKESIANVDDIGSSFQNVIDSLCSEKGFGYGVLANYLADTNDSRFKMYIYDGRSKSDVIFSMDNETLTSYISTQSTDSNATHIFLKGESFTEESEQDSNYEYNDSGEVINLNTDTEEDAKKSGYYTVMVDGKNYGSGIFRREVTESSEIDRGGNTNNKYFNRLTAEAKGAFGTKYRWNKRFVDGSLSKISNYIYGTDFDLGDIVTVKDNYGNSSMMRIASYTISSDSSGYREYPVFEEYSSSSWKANSVTDSGENYQTVNVTFSYIDCDNVVGSKTFEIEKDDIISYYANGLPVPQRENYEFKYWISTGGGCKPTDIYEENITYVTGSKSSILFTPYMEKKKCKVTISTGSHASFKINNVTQTKLSKTFDYGYTLSYDKEIVLVPNKFSTGQARIFDQVLQLDAGYIVNPRDPVSGGNFTDPIKESDRDYTLNIITVEDYLNDKEGNGKYPKDVSKDVWEINGATVDYIGKDEFNSYDDDVIEYTGNHWDSERNGHSYDDDLDSDYIWSDFTTDHAEYSLTGIDDSVLVYSEYFPCGLETSTNGIICMSPLYYDSSDDISNYGQLYTWNNGKYNLYNGTPVVGNTYYYRQDFPDIKLYFKDEDFGKFKEATGSFNHDQQYYIRSDSNLTDVSSYVMCKIDNSHSTRFEFDSIDQIYHETSDTEVDTSKTYYIRSEKDTVQFNTKSGKFRTDETYTVLSKANFERVENPIDSDIRLYFERGTSNVNVYYAENPMFLQYYPYYEGDSTYPAKLNPKMVYYILKDNTSGDSASDYRKITLPGNWREITFFDSETGDQTRDFDKYTVYYERANLDSPTKDSQPDPNKKYYIYCTWNDIQNVSEYRGKTIYAYKKTYKQLSRSGATAVSFVYTGTDDDPPEPYYASKYNANNGFEPVTKLVKGKTYWFLSEGTDIFDKNERYFVPVPRFGIPIYYSKHNKLAWGVNDDCGTTTYGYWSNLNKAEEPIEYVRRLDNGFCYYASIGYRNGTAYIGVNVFREADKAIVCQDHIGVRINQGTKLYVGCSDLYYDARVHEYAIFYKVMSYDSNNSVLIDNCGWHTFEVKGWSCCNYISDKTDLEKGWLPRNGAKSSVLPEVPNNILYGPYTTSNTSTRKPFNALSWCNQTEDSQFGVSFTKRSGLDTIIADASFNDAYFDSDKYMDYIIVHLDDRVDAIWNEFNSTVIPNSYKNQTHTKHFNYMRKMMTNDGDFKITFRNIDSNSGRKLYVKIFNNGDSVTAISGIGNNNVTVKLSEIISSNSSMFNDANHIALAAVSVSPDTIDDDGNILNEKVLADDLRDMGWSDDDISSLIGRDIAVMYETPDIDNSVDLFLRANDRFVITSTTRCVPALKPSDIEKYGMKLADASTLLTSRSINKEEFSNPYTDVDLDYTYVTATSLYGDEATKYSAKCPEGKIDIYFANNPSSERASTDYNGTKFGEMEESISLNNGIASFDKQLKLKDGSIISANSMTSGVPSYGSTDVFGNCYSTSATYTEYDFNYGPSGQALYPVFTRVYDESACLDITTACMSCSSSSSAGAYAAKASFNIPYGDTRVVYAPCQWGRGNARTASLITPSSFANDSNEEIILSKVNGVNVNWNLQFGGFALNKFKDPSTGAYPSEYDRSLHWNLRTILDVLASNNLERAGKEDLVKTFSKSNVLKMTGVSEQFYERHMARELSWNDYIDYEIPVSWHNVCPIVKAKGSSGTLFTPYKNVGIKPGPASLGENGEILKGKDYYTYRLDNDGTYEFTEVLKPNSANVSSYCFKTYDKDTADVCKVKIGGSFRTTITLSDKLYYPIGRLFVGNTDVTNLYMSYSSDYKTITINVPYVWGKINVYTSVISDMEISYQVRSQCYYPENRSKCKTDGWLLDVIKNGMLYSRDMGMTSEEIVKLYHTDADVIAEEVEIDPPKGLGPEYDPEHPDQEWPDYNPDTEIPDMDFPDGSGEDAKQIPVKIIYLGGKNGEYTTQLKLETSYAYEGEPVYDFDILDFEGYMFKGIYTDPMGQQEYNYETPASTLYILYDTTVFDMVAVTVYHYGGKDGGPYNVFLAKDVCNTPENEPLYMWPDHSEEFSKQNYYQHGVYTDQKGRKEYSYETVEKEIYVLYDKFDFDPEDPDIEIPDLEYPDEELPEEEDPWAADPPPAGSGMVQVYYMGGYDGKYNVKLDKVTEYAGDDGTANIDTSREFEGYVYKGVYSDNRGSEAYSGSSSVAYVLYDEDRYTITYILDTDKTEPKIKGQNVIVSRSTTSGVPHLGIRYATLKTNQDTGDKYFDISTEKSSDYIYRTDVDVYTDPELTTKFVDYSTPISENLTLYAKWGVPIDVTVKYVDSEGKPLKRIKDTVKKMTYNLKNYDSSIQYYIDPSLLIPHLLGPIMIPGFVYYYREHSEDNFEVIETVGNISDGKLFVYDENSIVRHMKEDDYITGFTFKGLYIDNPPSNKVPYPINISKNVTYYAKFSDRTGADLPVFYSLGIDGNHVFGANKIPLNWLNSGSQIGCPYSELISLGISSNRSVNGGLMVESSGTFNGQSYKYKEYQSTSAIHTADPSLTLGGTGGGLYNSSRLFVGSNGYSRFTIPWSIVEELPTIKEHAKNTMGSNKNGSLEIDFSIAHSQLKYIDITKAVYNGEFEYDGTSKGSEVYKQYILYYNVGSMNSDMIKELESYVKSNGMVYRCKEIIGVGNVTDKMNNWISKISTATEGFKYLGIGFESDAYGDSLRPTPNKLATINTDPGKLNELGYVYYPNIGCWAFRYAGYVYAIKIQFTPNGNTKFILTSYTS